MKKQLLACVLVCGSVLAQAQDEKPSDWRFMARIGVGFGGQNMLSGNYSNTGYYELNAGAGLKYAIGFDYRLSPKVTLQTSLGREVSMIPATEGHLVFVRRPIEVLSLYDLGKDYRIGGGLRYSTGAEVIGTGIFAGPGWNQLNGTYESTLGFVIEGQYIISSNKNAGQFGVTARYVNESFKRNGISYIGEHAQLALVLYY